MAARSTSGIGLRDVGFGIACLASVAFTLLAQLAWIIAFDASGLDAYAPDALFVTVLPALTVALVPAGIARKLYDENVPLVAGALVFAASAALSVLTIRAFMLCGGAPGC